MEWAKASRTFWPHNSPSKSCCPAPRTGRRILTFSGLHHGRLSLVSLWVSRFLRLPMAHTSPPHTTSHISHLVPYDTLYFTSLSLVSHSTSLHLFILDVCWLGNQLEDFSFFFLNTFVGPKGSRDFGPSHIKPKAHVEEEEVHEDE